ncbi:hypothetical protein, partial [Streptococcus rupicaprae]
NLGSKTSKIQKPHSDSFILIVFKTEITAWFYFETSFCPASFCGRDRFILLSREGACQQEPQGHHLQ